MNETYQLFGRRCVGCPLRATIAETAPEVRPRSGRATRAPGPSTREPATSSQALPDQPPERTLGSGVPPALVRPLNYRLERHPTAHEQGADALGRVELASGDRQQVDAEPVHVSCNLSDRLSGVGMKKNAMLAGDARISAIGWIVPTSLLACMMLTRIVRGGRVGGRRDRPAAASTGRGHVPPEAFLKTTPPEDRRMLIPGHDQMSLLPGGATKAPAARDCWPRCRRW